jgi:hypothetical protein
MSDTRENGLSTYLAEISKIPLLSSSEEIRLSKLALAGEASARKKLIVSNLRLVVSIAKKYLYYGLPLTGAANFPPMPRGGSVRPSPGRCPTMGAPCVFPYILPTMWPATRNSWSRNT